MALHALQVRNLSEMAFHCERSRINRISLDKKQPADINTTPAAAAPAVRKRPERILRGNCSRMVSLAAGIQTPASGSPAGAPRG